MYNQNPLLDLEFLHELDNHRNRISYARITSLTVDQYPIEQIEGVVTDGNITIDGNSAVRRICSLTMTTKNVNLNNVYWGVTNRVKIEIGLARNFDENLNNVFSDRSVVKYTGSVDQYKDLDKKYENYPDIIWFPLGIFILQDFKTSQQVNNYTITLTGKDKMCLLNGDIGGVFNAETDLGKEEVQQDDGGYVKIYRSIPYIIKEMVHHYAQEPFNNIIIRDANELALEVLRNNSDVDVYIIKDKLTEEYYEIIDSRTGYTESEYVDPEHPTEQIDFTNLGDNFVFEQNVDEDNVSLIYPDGAPEPTVIKRLYKDEENEIYDSADCTVIKISNGEDIGYQIREFTYPEDLIAGIGETVTSILDKIVKQFGNYEYFYNIEGQFVFQAKKTYVNTPWNNIIYPFAEDEEMYIGPAAVSEQVVYNFEGSALTTAYQNTPNIGKVKNDYTVWGKKRSSSGQEVPIHARYAIDVKPYFYKSFDGIIYATDEIDESVIGESEANNEWKEHPIPPYLTDKVSWWHIVDWKNYYTAVTELEPTEKMRYYQAADTKGFSSRLYFPGGKEHYDLIVAFENPPAEKEKYVVYIGERPAFIFDVQASGPFENYPVGWKGWKDELCLTPISGISTAFQHRLGGCTAHSYDWFLEMSKNYGYNSYVYQPTITDKSTIVNKDKLLLDVVKCDWREIIYQMAKDYYQHNHDDDFYWKLRLNNYMPNAGIALYQNGHTGYEQYYHDIEGFWRQLYNPYSAEDDSNRQSYFDSFRKIIASPNISYLDTVTFKLKPTSDGDYELINENNGAKYQFTLNQLIDRDNLIGEKEYLISEKEFLLAGYKKEANEYYKKYGRQAAQVILDRIETLENEIIDLKTEVEEDIANVMPGYSSFKYQCANEEDFYKNIVFTQRGFPVLQGRIPLDEEVYGHWNKDVIDNPSNLLFWFDFYNADSIGIGQFSVPAIGDRPKVINNDAVRAIIYKDIPDIVFIKESDYNKYEIELSALGDYTYFKTTKIISEEEDDNHEKVIVEESSSFIYDLMNEQEPKIVLSTRGITAQEQIDDMLYNNAYCNENITITSIPIYYLEPNTIISAKDEQRVVNGYYILNKMTIPLKYNGTMQITAIRVPERVY